MKKIKMTVVSGKTLKDTLVQLQRIADRIDEKENKSISRAFCDFVGRKPIIGKESITKKVMRKFKKGDEDA